MNRMDTNIKDLSRRWKIVQEQLISLWAFHKRSPGANEFFKVLNEGFAISTMSLSIFTQICYFLLGIINREERDKLIKWPLINIQGQVKFRKGVSAIVKGLIEKYPESNLKWLPESHLMDPSHNQKKISEFILKLSNIAIHLTVCDPYLLVMRTRNDLNASEIGTAITVIKRARIIEEKVIKEKTFPISKFEDIRMNITNKCVALKQENSDLTNKLNKLKKKFVDGGLLQGEGDCSVDYLKKHHNEKLNDISEINDKLKKHSDLSTEVMKNMKASGEPVTLSADDLHLGKDTTLADISADAYDKLNIVFDILKCKDALPEEKAQHLERLETVRNMLLNEKKVLHAFLQKYSSEIDGGFISL